MSTTWILIAQDIDLSVKAVLNQQNNSNRKFKRYVRAVNFKVDNKGRVKVITQTVQVIS